MEQNVGEQDKKTIRLSGLQITGIVAGTVVIAVAATLLIIESWLFPSPFDPVILSPAETQQLERKLAQFDHMGGQLSRSAPSRSREEPTPEDLGPEPYSEKGASREIRLSDREINGMIAQNTDLATRLVVHFSNDLVSVKLLIPVDPDFPIMGGKVLKVKGGAEFAFRNGRPVVILRGISVMGVPLPNAWLGGMKNIDLIQEFGSDPGFWQAFAEGVASIQVRDGSLLVVLKE